MTGVQTCALPISIVMQPRPGRVFADIPVPLPRPRDRLGADFAEVKRAILAALDGSLSQPPVAEPKMTRAAAGWW